MISRNIIIPKTTSEALLYSTIRITGKKHGEDCSYGTGFFYNVKLNEEKEIQLILTNKHVVNDCDDISFSLHEATNDFNPSGSSFQITLQKESLWKPHPDPSVDLGALYFSPIRKNAKDRYNKIIFNRVFDETLIKDDSELLEITSVADEILMVGYPIGLWDEYNNFPIVRKGITATHPAINYSNQSIGIADIACFPGSSGSPILVCMEGAFPNKKGSLVLGNKLVFLGLLSSGPYWTSQGKIEVFEIPTSNIHGISINQQMIHLGYYVKAKEILALCNLIKEEYNQNHKG